MNIIILVISTIFLVVSIILPYIVYKSKLAKISAISGSNEEVLIGLLKATVGIYAFNFSQMSKHIRLASGNKFLNNESVTVQLKNILNQFSEYLSDTADIYRQNISVYMLYKPVVTNDHTFSGYKDYIFLGCKDSINKSVTFDNPNSIERQIIDNKSKLVFCADKRNRCENFEYIPDEKDKPYNNTGTIICKDISVIDCKSNDIFIKSILVINTYGNQLCSEGDDKSKKLILETIVSYFENIIVYTLGLMYISDNEIKDRFGN